MSWYRTHRPHRIADLHLSKVRETFSQLLQQGTLSQVMLFAGPKGTGKTTTARIIAAVANDPQNYAVIEHLFFKKPAPAKVQLLEPDETNQDLIPIFEGRSFLVQELDAASNRGIDDVRAIKDRVNVPPQQGLITVYILDEAHMLTTEAFNALLKLLEEPPPHVLFILATTELHKIPETIKSRATLIEFTKATPLEITAALEKVMSLEKKEFEAEALSLIAQAADGSFRDAVKMAESVASTAQVLTATLVANQLTHNVQITIPELLAAVIEKQPEKVTEVFQELRQKNLDQTFFTKQLFEFLHTSLLQHIGTQPGKSFGSQAIVLFLLQELTTLPVQNPSPIAFLPLELKLLDLIFRSQEKSKKSSSPPPSSAASKTPATHPTVKVEALTRKLVEPTLELIQMAPSDTATQARPVSDPTQGILTHNILSDNLLEVTDGNATKLLEQWQAFINLVHLKNSSLGALLRSSRPLDSVTGRARIAVFYKFHKEQLQQPKFMKMIDECLPAITGGLVKLEFVLQDPAVMSALPIADLTSHTDQALVKLAEELLV